MPVEHRQLVRLQDALLEHGIPTANPTGGFGSGTLDLRVPTFRNHRLHLDARGALSIYDRTQGTANARRHRHLHNADLGSRGWATTAAAAVAQVLANPVLVKTSGRPKTIKALPVDMLTLVEVLPLVSPEADVPLVQGTPQETESPQVIAEDGTSDESQTLDREVLAPNLNNGGVRKSARRVRSNPEEVLQFILAFEAGASASKIANRLGYTDKDRIQHAVLGERYPFSDPPLRYQASFDSRRLQMVHVCLDHLRKDVQGRLDRDLARLAWRLNVPIPDEPALQKQLMLGKNPLLQRDAAGKLSWCAYRYKEEPGTLPPEGFRVDADMCRLATSARGEVLVWDDRYSWKPPPRLRSRDGRIDLIVTVNSDRSNVNVAAAVLRAWKGPPPEPHYVVGYLDGDVYNLAISNLEWQARR